MSLALALYWPALHGTFVFDDTHILEAAPGRLLDDPIRLLTAIRPVVTFTYGVTHRLAGFDAFLFHLFNIVLHGLNGLALWRFLAALPAPAGRWNPILVHGVPLLFVASPIQTESAAYISGRSELLAALFYFLALRLSLAGWRRRRPWPSALLMGMLYALAAGSKEHALTLPLAVLLVDWIFQPGSLREKGRTYLPTYAVLLVVATIGGIVLLRPVIAAPSAGFFLADVPWRSYFYTQLRVYFLYLQLLVWPYPLNADYDIRPSHSLWHHGSWLAALGAAGLVYAAVRWRRRAPVVCFGALLFFVTLAPTSSVFPLADYAAERRLYLPSTGFYLATVGLARAVLPSASRLAPGVLAAVLVLYGIGTVERCRLWSDSVALWRQTARQSPRKYRPHNNLGVESMRRQEFVEAEAAFREAEKLVAAGSLAHAHIRSNLGLTYAGRQMFAEAIEHYQAAAAIADLAVFRANLGIAQLRLGREAEGWHNLNKAVESGSDEPRVWLARGHENLRAGRIEEAIHDYERVLALNPDHASARGYLEAARSGLIVREPEADRP